MARGVKTGGRKPGTPNKINAEFRETVRLLLEANAANVARWLELVAEGSEDVKPDPARALDLLSRLAEFAAPKLARTEHVGQDGGPINSRIVLEVAGVCPRDPPQG